MRWPCTAINFMKLYSRDPIRRARLGSIVIRDTFLAFRPWCSWTCGTAEEHLRVVAVVIHDDLVQLIVGLQRMIPARIVSPRRWIAS